MLKNKSACSSGNYHTPGKVAPTFGGMPIVQHEDEFLRGTKYAGIAFVLLFVVLSAGVVMFGW